MHLPTRILVSMGLMFMFSSTWTMAQNPKMKIFSFGPSTLGNTDADDFDDVLPVLPGPGRKSPVLVERQNIKSYMMPVRKMSNGGNLLAYTMASCLEFYINLDRNYKVNLSPDYISLNLKYSKQRINPLTVFQFLAEEGTVSAAILPFGSNQLTNGVYATQKYQIEDYLHLFRPETKGNQRVFEARKAILKGHPILIELAADDQLPQMNGDRYFEPGQEAYDTYPLIVVGYDEGEEAFEATSCWGRSWGENGYIWIHYSDFGKYAKNGYVMMANPAEYSK